MPMARGDRRWMASAKSGRGRRRLRVTVPPGLADVLDAVAMLGQQSPEQAAASLVLAALANAKRDPLVRETMRSRRRGGLRVAGVRPHEAEADAQGRPLVLRLAQFPEDAQGAARRGRVRPGGRGAHSVPLRGGAGDRRSGPGRAGACGQQTALPATSQAAGGDAVTPPGEHHGAREEPPGGRLVPVVFPLGMAMLALAVVDHAPAVRGTLAVELTKMWHAYQQSGSPCCPVPI